MLHDLVTSTDLPFLCGDFSRCFPIRRATCRASTFALVDNFFFLTVCVMVIGRLVRVAREITSRGTKDE